MTIPATAALFDQAIDPDDTVDFTFAITAGDASSNLLQTGESVASYTLALTPESVAAGLQLMTGGGYGPCYSNYLFTFWVSVDPSKRQQAIFSAGATLGVELTVVTDNTPPRVRNRTLGILVVLR